MEGTWSEIKRSLRNHAAHVEGEFDHYLTEYMWRRRRGHSKADDVFREFLLAITSLYPPMEKDVPSSYLSSFGLGGIFPQLSDSFPFLCLLNGESFHYPPPTDPPRPGLATDSRKER
ncbi:hypothetical protein TNCV_4438381 [Trichonephila clavipes]|nr:hypothetical protein TNCV_4438381 [Trichonephila clavipes]